MKESLPSYVNMELKFMEICNEIKENGIVLDLELCNKYIQQLKDEIAPLDNILKSKMPAKINEALPLTKVFKKDGTYTANALNWINSGKPYVIDSTVDPVVMTRHSFEPANPASPEQIRDYLLSLGWSPSDDPSNWNYKKVKTAYGKLEFAKDKEGNYIKSSPKLPTDDKELEKLAKLSPDFDIVAQRMVRSHRLHSLEGYIKNCRPDGRIPMIINSCGTNTMRVTHAIVANVPRVTSFFGKELRSVFRVPDDKVMIGCDAIGLEAFVMAHYLNNSEFTSFILENKKIHSYFHDKCKDLISDINQQKNANYAYLYGAGDAKLGTFCDKIDGTQKERGKVLRERLNKSIPGLDKLQERLEKEFNSYGGIVGIDGRLIKCRKKSALINTLFQSAGAIACKIALCHTKNDLDKLYIPYKIIIMYHDEWEIETEEKYSRQVGKVMVDSLRKAGEYLKFNIPLLGEYKIGKNWSEVH